jgi:deoxyribodipyrimidine photo-lyase
MKRVLHWFRRDLRLSDNTALSAASREVECVIPVYVLSEWNQVHRWTGANRQQFLCGCLASLEKNLLTIGGRLIIRQGDPVAELERLVTETKAEAIFFNRDPDPHGRETERRLALMCAKRGILFRDFKDVCVHERDEILTGSGGPFRVFTPYSKAWHKAPRAPSIQRPSRLATPSGIASLPLPSLETWNLTGAALQIPEPGEKAARKRLSRFLSEGLAGYGDARNFPGETSTSRLSQDLRFGLLSIREVFEAVEKRAAELPAAGRESAAKFSSELIWREFYMQVLWHFPEVLEHEFNPNFRGMRWSGKMQHFDLWSAGMTGYPIVDAAMRELEATGFMHNRARMIAAMFLTKDLHVDWRLGEKFFMQKLTDGEIASNNGGWQWSAGTGADAAPYFRIQNPWTQTKRYDPEGAYIKTWIPELRDLPAEKFFEPPASGQPLAKGYPPPIVNHAEAREITLELFARHRAVRQQEDRTSGRARG